MRALANYPIEVRGVSTIRRGATPVREFKMEYAHESRLGDLVEALGGYRYNRDAVMFARLAWRVGKRLARDDPDVLHLGFASHSLFSLLNDLVGDAAVVAQTFGGIEHGRLLEALDTPSRVDAYVSTTDADLTALESIGVPAANCHGIDPPIFLDRFGDIDQSAARDQFDLPDDAFVAGYFGNVNESRFPYTVAEALDSFAANASVEGFVVTKQIEDRDVRDLEHLTVHTGNLSDAEKRAAYAAADVWTFPFRELGVEGAPAIDPPLTLLEAMASGRPVVATDTLSMGEAVVDAENGYLIQPGDPSALVDRLQTLRSDSGACERLGRAARRTIRERYSPSAAADRLVEIYEHAQTHARN
ncbi:Glycosyltransferase [Halapricum desulfuricans]|uniref:Glycosyltransferase n=2 Tax=Halapricum desulfuricans TaxID=2841257 RepID=A0A897NAX1_9EURY|nr:Glycosyltransferase [Halapricum desulfuricans]